MTLGGLPIPIPQVKQQCRPDGGSLLSPQTPAVDNALLLAVQALPKTGSVKAKALLSNFESEFALFTSGNIVCMCYA